MLDAESPTSDVRSWASPVAPPPETLLASAKLPADLFSAARTGGWLPESLAAR